MNEFDLPQMTAVPRVELPTYEESKQTQIESDKSYAMKLARDESMSDSESDSINFQSLRLNESNKVRNDNLSKDIELEKSRLYRESEQIKIERDRMKKYYDDTARNHHRDQTQQLYREKYDIEKERRLMNLGLNLIPSHAYVGRNILEDKIETLVKRELNKDNNQRSESDLIELITSLVKKSAPTRRPPKKKSATHSRPTKKKSAKKKSAKKKSAKKKSAKKKSAKK
jgi:hypothetical protein